MFTVQIRLSVLRNIDLRLEAFSPHVLTQPLAQPRQYVGQRGDPDARGTCVQMKALVLWPDSQEDTKLEEDRRTTYHDVTISAVSPRMNEY